MIWQMRLNTFCTRWTGSREGRLPSLPIASLEGGWTPAASAPEGQRCEAYSNDRNGEWGPHTACRPLSPLARGEGTSTKRLNLIGQMLHSMVAKPGNAAIPIAGATIGIAGVG